MLLTSSSLDISGGSGIAILLEQLLKTLRGDPSAEALDVEVGELGTSSHVCIEAPTRPRQTSLVE